VLRRELCGVCASTWVYVHVICTTTDMKGENFGERLSCQAKDVPWLSNCQETERTYEDLREVVCPQIFSTDVNGFMCKTNLAVRALGVAAQRITSSAWKRREGGMVRPRAWAVFRLITNLTCVGCSTGRSAGLVPRRTLATSVAARRYKSVTLGP
jgi:hypothetical protein